MSDCSVTSPAPSAIDGTAGILPSARSWAVFTVSGMPTARSSWTAARLLDVRSAVRSVMLSAPECSSSGT